MEKFTKGEWTVKPLEDDKEYIRIRGTRLGEKYKIANAIDLKAHHDDSEWCERDRKESMANAHLIAASPRLYEELKKLDPENDALKLARGEILPSLTTQTKG